MFNIKDFLSKFNKIDIDRESKLKQIIDSVQTYSGVILTPEEILITDGKNVRIKSSPIKRNQIFMNREKILSDLDLKGIKITLL